MLYETNAQNQALELRSRTKNALTETFSANNVNELTTISRSGTLTVAGTTTSPATGVNVSGTGISGSQPAAVYADSTSALGGVTPANCYVFNCCRTLSGTVVVALRGFAPRCHRILQPNYRALVVALRPDWWGGDLREEFGVVPALPSYEGTFALFPTVAS